MPHAPGDRGSEGGGTESRFDDDGSLRLFSRLPDDTVRGPPVGSPDPGGVRSSSFAQPSTCHDEGKSNAESCSHACR